jgi:hypothetical protein
VTMGVIFLFFLVELGWNDPPLKAYNFFTYIKISIDGYITRPYWFWGTNSVFGLSELIFTYLTHKSTYFLYLYKISDRLMGRTTILILGPKFRFWPQIPFMGSEGLFSAFWPLKVYIFLMYTKFPIDGCITRPYWFRAVFGLWGLIFTYLTTKSMYFLYLYKISNRLMGRMPFFIFEPPVLSLGIRRISKFFELRTLIIKLQNILPF